MEIHNRSFILTKESRKTVHAVIAMDAAAVVIAVVSVEAEAALRVQVVADLPAVQIADSALVVVVKAARHVRDSVMIDAMTAVIAVDLAGTEIRGRVLKILRWFRGSSF